MMLRDLGLENASGRLTGAGRRRQERGERKVHGARESVGMAVCEITRQEGVCLSVDGGRA